MIVLLLLWQSMDHGGEYGTGGQESYDRRGRDGSAKDSVGRVRCDHPGGRGRAGLGDLRAVPRAVLAPPGDTIETCPARPGTDPKRAGAIPAR